MGRADIYYLAKLDPPPTFVCIRNCTYAAGTVWRTEDVDACRIFINCLQTGTIREFWESGFEQILEAGEVYTDVGGGHLQQELPSVSHELSLRIYAAAPAVALSAREVAVRQLVRHEVILPGRITDPDTARQVVNLIRAADLNAPPEDELRSMKLRTSMYQILLLLTRSAIDQARNQLRLKEQNCSRNTAAAIRYIKGHLQEKLNVETIANAAGDNYNHLKTIFRREVGMTMVEYINHLRIQQVKELIARNDCPAEAAGEAVGIPDVKYLRRLFRRYTGMTIKEYRHVCRTTQYI